MKPPLSPGSRSQVPGKQLRTFTGRIAGKFHPNRRKSIFLVDDDEVVRELTGLMLKKLGYRVRSFSGGATALTYLNRHRDEADLYLLDVIMPEMDGRELFRKIRRINPSARGYYYSGYCPHENTAPVSLDGILGLIAKPATLADLDSRIREALEMN